jgi:hypothetical protein
MQYDEFEQGGDVPADFGEEHLMEVCYVYIHICGYIYVHEQHSWQWHA